MYAQNLRNELTVLARKYAEENKLNMHVEPKSAVIFENIQDNFFDESFEEIEKSLTQNEGKDKRFSKPHTQIKNVLELQSSNSSDALLMNIFCHPKIKSWKGIQTLLKIDAAFELAFAHYPGVLLKNESKDSTEVDLFIKSGDKLIYCESKLTEGDFVYKPKAHFERYKNIKKVFDIDRLPVVRGEIANYQLVRNILAAHEVENNNGYFYLFCDMRRPDLAKSFFETVSCIESMDLRNRCKIYYWQDIAAFCGKSLQEYLKNKYGINA
jgi:hypothetical protein